MSKQIVCVVRDDLLLVSGARWEEFDNLRTYIKDVGLKVAVIGFGDAEFMDMRGAPPEVGAAAQIVIDWVEARS